MADYTPWWIDDADIVTLKAGATAVTGGNLVKVGAADMTVIPTTAVTEDAAVGVAAYDGAIGADVGVYAFGPVHRFVANGAVTRGDHVGPGAVAGTVATSAVEGGAYVQADANRNARAIIGIALESAADLGFVRVMITRH